MNDSTRFTGLFFSCIFLRQQSWAVVRCWPVADNILHRPYCTIYALTFFEVFVFAFVSLGCCYCCCFSISTELTRAVLTDYTLQCFVTLLRSAAGATLSAPSCGFPLDEDKGNIMAKYGCDSAKSGDSNSSLVSVCVVCGKGTHDLACQNHETIGFASS